MIVYAALFYSRIYMFQIQNTKKYLIRCWPVFKGEFKYEYPIIGLF